MMIINTTLEAILLFLNLLVSVNHLRVVGKKKGEKKSIPIKTKAHMLNECYVGEHLESKKF